MHFYDIVSIRESIKLLKSKEIYKEEGKYDILSLQLNSSVQLHPLQLHGSNDDLWRDQPFANALWASRRTFGHPNWLNRG